MNPIKLQRRKHIYSYTAYKWWYTVWLIQKRGLGCSQDSRASPVLSQASSGWHVAPRRQRGGPRLLELAGGASDLEAARGGHLPGPEVLPVHPQGVDVLGFAFPIHREWMFWVLLFPSIGSGCSGFCFSHP